jgi:hypothetical protein
MIWQDGVQKILGEVGEMAGLGVKIVYGPLNVG